jgi:hypothetical protein
MQLAEPTRRQMQEAALRSRRHRRYPERQCRRRELLHHHRYLDLDELRSAILVCDQAEKSQIRG